MSDQTSGQPRRPKGRSPSYPAINLESAVQRVRTLYEKERQHATSVDTIVKHWGYKSFNGPASLTLAALKKFGLVEDEGAGASRRAKVSDLAVDIIANPNPEARRDAIQTAALRPAIHRELWDAYGSRPPSDDNLRWELTRERGFTETGASEFIPEYQATVAYAQLTDGGTVEPQTAEAQRDDDHDQEVDSERPPPRQQGRERRMTESGASAYTIPLVGGAAVIVEGAFPISERDWNQFIAVLNAMKPGLVGGAQDEATET